MVRARLVDIVDECNESFELEWNLKGNWNLRISQLEISFGEITALWPRNIKLHSDLFVSLHRSSAKLIIKCFTTRASPENFRVSPQNSGYSSPVGNNYERKICKHLMKDTQDVDLVWGNVFDINKKLGRKTTGENLFDCRQIARLGEGRRRKCFNVY